MSFSNEVVDKQSLIQRKIVLLMMKAKDNYIHVLQFFQNIRYFCDLEAPNVALLLETKRSIIYCNFVI